MSTWPNPAILKNSREWNLPARLKNPPKGKDPAVREEWMAERKEFRRDKLMILGKLPKVSRSAE